MSLTISVIVCAYNEERFLPACLASLARQTRPPDEIPGAEVTKNHSRARENAHIVALGIERFISADQSPEDVLREIRHSWKTLIRAEKSWGSRQGRPAEQRRHRHHALSQRGVDQERREGWVHRGSRTRGELTPPPGRSYGSHLATSRRAAGGSQDRIHGSGRREDRATRTAMIRMLRAAAISAFNRRPVLRRAVHATWEPIFGFALLPFRLPRGRGSAVEQRDLVRRTEEYNQAAERYYAEYPDPQYLLDKPFSDTPDFAAHMIAVGNLVAGARLRPGDTVVEFGAGPCWLSHFLNRYGCRTISVDVSRTALAAGRRLFERDPRTNWSLDPQFLPYDGHTLPLDNGACDRVVVYDAFHHVPNQREVLSEMYRVLAPDGVVAMSEPGKGHASSPTSIAESAGTGVLENELVIEDVGVLAEDVGFGAVNVLAEGPARRYEIPVRELGRFKGGRGFRRYWSSLCVELLYHHYVLLYKGSSRATTERPGKLSSELRIVGPAGPVALSRGARLRVDLRVANIGDTCWLHRGAGDSRAGWTRVGVHMHEAGEPVGKVIDFDWHRAEFDGDVEPESSVRVRCDLPAIHRAGAYDLQFDLVVEGLTWFAERGASRPPRLRVNVS